jgi:Fusaric acid resistance protein-like
MKSLLVGDRFLGSVQVAVAVLLASLVTIIPALREQFNFSYWSALTVVLVMERSSLAASFNNSVMRMLGTVTGAIWGYLSVLVTDGEVWSSLALLFLWVWIAGYVRSAPAFSYAGTVSAFTCAIVMYTAEGSDDIRDVALSRIEQVGYGGSGSGCMCTCVYSFFFFFFLLLCLPTFQLLCWCALS